MELNINEIKKIIPHRYPILLVDKILDFEKGKYAIGLKNVSESDSWLQGHFPDNPIMPGVLQVEAMAQVAAVTMMQLEGFKDKTPLFAGIKEAKFLKIVKPGDQLIIDVKIDKVKFNVGFAKGEIKVNDEVVSNAILIFTIM